VEMTDRSEHAPEDDPRPAESGATATLPSGRAPVGLSAEDCETLRDRVVWLVRVRWVVVAVGLVAVLAGWALWPTAAFWEGLLAAVLGVGLLNIVWSSRIRAGGQSACTDNVRFSLWQMVSDFAFLAVAVHLTGGIGGPLAPLFVLHGVFSAVLLPGSYTLGVGGLAALLLLSSVALERVWGWLPAWRLGDPGFGPTWLSPLLSLGFLGLAAGGASLIGLQLAGQLRTRHARVAELARELSLRNAELRQVDEQRLRLLGVASHDLVGPLAAMESRLDLFLGGYVGDLTPDQRTNLERVKTRLRELRDFIKDLLDLTAVETAVAPGTGATTFDVAAQLRDTVLELSPWAESKGVSLALTGVDRPLTVRAARARLGLVWTNLLTNGVKYGGGQPVTVSVETDDRFVRVAVRDRGPGIPPEHLGRLFTEFYRTPAAKASGIPGTGLGLAISRRVVTTAGGSIEVRSEPGEGTTFTVRLPLVEPEEPTER